MKRLSLILLSAACLALGLASGLATASAQDKYPSRPVKVIVPYAPGGATDIVARLVGDAFQKITGQPFVVLNKPGAFGMLAIDEMVKSEPDGYTLMLGNVSTNAITPIIYAKKMNSDYQKTVVAVTNLVDVPAFLVVTTANDFPVKTVAELIDYAKKNPGKVSYGTVGVGSYPHYDMAYFAKRAGDLDMIGLPNKNGASGVIQDMLRGDVQAAFLNVASTAGMVQSGKFRPIAMVNRARLAEYPCSSDHAGGWLRRRRHRGVERFVRAGGHAKAGARSGIQRREQSAAIARVDRKTQEAEFQYRAEQIVGRRPDLARRRNEALADHHQRGENRSRAVSFVRPC